MRQAFFGSRRTPATPLLGAVLLSDTAFSGGGTRTAMSCGAAGRPGPRFAVVVGSSCLGAEAGLTVASGFLARKLIARSTEFVGLVALPVSGLNLNKDFPSAPRATVLNSGRADPRFVGASEQGWAITLPARVWAGAKAGEPWPQFPALSAQLLVLACYTLSLV